MDVLTPSLAKKGRSCTADRLEVVQIDVPVQLTLLYDGSPILLRHSCQSSQAQFECFHLVSVDAIPGE